MVVRRLAICSPICDLMNTASVASQIGSQFEATATTTTVSTHTFDNHMPRARAPRLERGPNHGGPSPLTQASRCGLGGSALPCARVYADGEVDPKTMGSLR